MVTRAQRRAFRDLVVAPDRPPKNRGEQPDWSESTLETMAWICPRSPTSPCSSSSSWRSSRADAPAAHQSDPVSRRLLALCLRGRGTRSAALCTPFRGFPSRCRERPLSRLASDACDIVRGETVLPLELEYSLQRGLGMELGIELLDACARDSRSSSVPSSSNGPRR